MSFTVVIPGSGECYELEGTTRKGYVRFAVGPHGDRKVYSAHRVAWIAANGPIPEGAQVLHHCDNPACIRASHLYLGTNDDNVRDRVMRMRSWHKLTDEEVAEIRSLYGRYGRGGVSGRDLAARFSISTSQLSRIVNQQRRA